MSIVNLFDFVKNLIDSLGYPGVFFGTFLETVFPPIPSEVIMGFSGFLIHDGRFEWLPVIIAAVLGNMLGCSLLWYLSHRYGKRGILKYGKYVGVTEADFDNGEKLFKKYGYSIVFLCQMVPAARTLIAIPAGALKTKYQYFILANTLGATIWLTFLAYLGYIFGSEWENIAEFIKPFEKAILIIVGLAIVLVIIKWLVPRLRASSQK